MPNRMAPERLHPCCTTQFLWKSSMFNIRFAGVPPFCLRKNPLVDGGLPVEHKRTTELIGHRDLVSLE